MRVKWLETLVSENSQRVVGFFWGSQRYWYDLGWKRGLQGLFIGTREIWRVRLGNGMCFWGLFRPSKTTLNVYRLLKSLKLFPSLANKSTSWWVVGTKIAVDHPPPPPSCVGRLRRNFGGNANQLRQGLQNEGITCALWQESIFTKCRLDVKQLIAEGYQKQHLT